MLLTGHTRPVFAMAIAPDGAMAATGSGDLTVRVWEADTGTTLRVLSGHQKQIQDLAFSPDGALLASSSLDRTIRVWDPFSGREIRCFECPVPLCTAFSPDGEVLVAGSLNGSLQFYHLASGRRLIEVKAHTGGVRGLVLLPEGRLATGSVDSTVRLWEVQG
jgi:WD40 repeat protein